jgi:hypothetical protein
MRTKDGLPLLFLRQQGISNFSLRHSANRQLRGVWMLPSYSASAADSNYLIA